MDKIDQKPIEGSADELLSILNAPFELVDKIKDFLSTHPLPQSILRTLHNMGL